MNESGSRFFRSHRAIAFPGGGQKSLASNPGRLPGRSRDGECRRRGDTSTCGKVAPRLLLAIAPPCPRSESGSIASSQNGESSNGLDPLLHFSRSPFHRTRKSRSVHVEIRKSQGGIP